MFPGFWETLENNFKLFLKTLFFDVWIPIPIEVVDSKVIGELSSKWLKKVE